MVWGLEHVDGRKQKQQNNTSMAENQKITRRWQKTKQKTTSMADKDVSNIGSEPPSPEKPTLHHFW